MPFTPIPKARPRFTRRGFAYTDKKTRDYESLVRSIAIKEYKQPISCPIEARLTFIMPIPSSLSEKKRKELIGKPHIKRPDTDNLIKILDSLNGVAFTDDSLIYKIIAEKRYGLEPKTIVELIPLI